MAEGTPIYNQAITCLCGNLATHHCNTCGDTLCTNCKITHQKSKATGHHSVVPYAERLGPDHVSSLSCSDHKGIECTYWCEKCGKATCIDCVTSTHKGHSMIKLEAILKEKRTMLQKELANLESGILKEWKDLLVEAKQVTADYLDKVDGVEKDLEAQAKKFHDKVEEIFKTSKQQLEAMKITNLDILHQQEKMVSKGLEKVKQEIRECEDKLRNGEIERLLQYEGSQDKKKETLPHISKALAPVFSPGQIETESLTEMFGKLDEQQAEDIKPDIKPIKSTVPLTIKINAASSPETTATTGESNSKLVNSERPQSQKISKRIKVPTPPQRKLMATTLVKSCFNNGFSSVDQSIACVGSGRVWVRTGARRLQLMDRHGALKDTIHTGFDFKGIFLSPQGEFLLTDTTNSCIKSISPDKEVGTLFTTQWKPYGLCCLHSGNVAVSFSDEGRVIIYSRSGKILQELDKKLFKQPYRMTQNNVNNDLCICDEGSKKVVALDTSYHLLYQYKGQDSTKFSPMGLCTDSAGRILITTCNFHNHSLHILDKDGKFLQYLLTWEQGLRDPVSIEVDREGSAWVGGLNGGVKVVKYLQ